jgi:trimeric autotransporter adhesin
LVNRTIVKKLLSQYYIMRSTICFFSFFIFHFSFSQTITTFAGSDSAGFSGDGGPATMAELGTPTGVAIDNSGNVYIADIYAKRIRIVNPTGIITTFAGIGFIGGNTGNGGPATAAGLFCPMAVALSGSGNVYIADPYANLVRMVNLRDTIIDFAGNGDPFGNGGDGGPATAAQLYGPSGVAIDDSGNVYIADQFNCEIRKVNKSGIISCIAGNDNFSGYFGDGGPATVAELNAPSGVTLDVSGNIYIADANNERVRKINTSGIINTIAGNGIAGFSGDGGVAIVAELNTPLYIEVDAYSNVFFTDFTNNRIRMVNTSGIIRTVVGNGIAGFSGDGGPASTAELNEPYGIALDASGSLYIADQNNARIRKVTNVTGIEEVTNNVNMVLYPNPNNGIFTIQWSVINSQPSVLEVYDVLGGRVLAETLRSAQGDNLINLTGQPNGIYLYRVTNESGNLIGEGKVIVER